MTYSLVWFNASVLLDWYCFCIYCNVSLPCAMCHHHSLLSSLRLLLLCSFTLLLLPPPVNCDLLHVEHIIRNAPLAPVKSPHEPETVKHNAETAKKPVGSQPAHATTKGTSNPLSKPKGSQVTRGSPQAAKRLAATTMLSP